jgi:ATP-dependent RNA helicase DeaD
MLAAIARAAYSEPTAVQAGIIPQALAGVDVLGQARTGTGKTAAFAIPILERLKHSRRGAAPQALVLVPTRELAVQVRDEFEKLAHGRRVACVPIYGGKPIRGQIAKLQRGADVVIGTPGRVLDHLARGSLNLQSVRTVVLDEADRMLDIGFRPDIEKILRRCPKERQTLLLSATVAPPVERLAQKYMTNPEVMDFSPKTMAVETIEQFYFTVDQERKFDLLVHLLKRDQPEQAIVFCRTKRGTERIYRRLTKHFPATDMMHGDMVQVARDRVMKKFRASEVRLLVATDVVGRGIDVTSISHIINYDIPQSSDDYVHRVGRTGRMGREGVAYTFVTTEEGGELTRIEMLINRLLKRDEIEGFAAVATVVSPAGPPAGTPSTADAEPAEPKPARPMPPGRRPPKRHRRAL